MCRLLARIYQKQFLYAIAFKISQETGFSLSPAIEVVSRGLRSKKMETKRLMGNYMCGEIERSFHIKFSMKAACTSFTDTESIMKFYSGGQKKVQRISSRKTRRLKKRTVIIDKNVINVINVIKCINCYVNFVVRNIASEFKRCDYICTDFSDCLYM